LVVSDTVKVDWGIVTDPKYFKELCKILSETSDETIQLFFIWKTIQGFSEFVEADALLPYKRFSKELQGKVSRAEVTNQRNSANYNRTLTQILRDGGLALATLMIALAGS
jgi:Peptidase family M13